MNQGWDCFSRRTPNPHPLAPFTIMICQRCKAEASVHLTESVDGRVKEVHLCGLCAKQAGVVVSGRPPELALDAVVQGLIVAHVGELVGELARAACPLCGTKFMEFRISGRLGCPNDYRTFEKGLIPLVRQAQGATRHVGKSPHRRASNEEVRLLRLRADLRDAVAREDYEEAARLRDLLRRKDVD